MAAIWAGYDAPVSGWTSTWSITSSLPWIAMPMSLAVRTSAVPAWPLVLR